MLTREGRMLEYKYTGRDLLEGPPEHYMYSAFGGVELLRVYAADREYHLRRMTAGPEPGESAEPEGLAEKWGPEDTLPEPGRHGDIDTMELLRRLARASVEPAGARQPAFAFWVDVIARKFEVVKRL